MRRASCACGAHHRNGRSAAAGHIPPSFVLGVLLEQREETVGIEVGGRLFAIVGEAPVMTARLVTCTAPGAYHTVDLFETVVAPLANAEQPARFRF